MFQGAMGIKLSKESFQTHHARCEHKGLIAVIPGAYVPSPEGFGHGQLGQFFAISKNPEFGFACQNFFASKQTGVTAFPTRSIVQQDFANQFILVQGGL
jgi:hypothetical protein